MRMPSFWHLKTCPEATQIERVGMKALSSIEHMILVDIDPLKNTNFFPKNTIIQITSWTILTRSKISVIYRKELFTLISWLWQAYAHCQNCIVQHNNSMLLAVKRVGKHEEQASNIEQVQKKEPSGWTRAHSIHCHLDWTCFSNKKSLLWNNLWKQRLREVPCEEIFQHWTIC